MSSFRALRVTRQVRAILTCAATMMTLAYAPFANAGGRPYAFTQGVDSLPETGLELENWLTEEKLAARTEPSWEWWFGPVTGITDQLEAGLFVILVEPAQASPDTATPGPTDEPGLGLAQLRLQVSYLLADRGAWPIDVRMRGEVGAPLARNSGGPAAEALDKEKTSIWYLVMASRDFGILNLTLNAGAWLEFEPETKRSGEKEIEIEPYVKGALGASVEALKGFRFGGELFGESVESFKGMSLLAGPALAFGHARYWLSAAVGFGLTDDSATHRGRLVVGVSF